MEKEKLNNLILDIYNLFQKYDSENLFYFCLIGEDVEIDNKPGLYEGMLIKISMGTFRSSLERLLKENGTLKQAVCESVANLLMERNLSYD